MSQFLANRSMENFFINPTMTQDNSMETFARISIMSEPSPKLRLDDFPLSEGVKEQKSRPVSTIQDLFLTHSFLTSYHSEEESASPRGSTDTLSLDADDEENVLLETPSPEEKATDPSAIDLFLVPEELAKSFTTIENRCNRAQAVVLKPVGKPKMVSMPKLVDVRPRQHKRSSTESFVSGLRSSLRRAESKKSVRSAISSRASFDRTEPMPALPISALPTPAEVEVDSAPATPAQSEPQRQPSIPLTKAANAIDHSAKHADSAAGSLSRTDIAIKRSVTVSAPEWSAADGSPMSPARRRLHRLASTITNASDIVRRKSSISSLRKPTSLASKPSRPSLSLDTDTTPKTPMGPIPKRRSSMGKLTPRGPTERAPIIVLPPCPDDEEEDDDFGDAGSAQAMSKWDRPRARQAAMYGKTRPSIDGIVAGSA